MKDCIINIFTVLNSIFYLFLRIVRYAFHLTPPKTSFAEYIRGEVSILNVVLV